MTVRTRLREMLRARPPHRWAPAVIALISLAFAGPARGAPVFDLAVLSPEVISPNGDLVQDLATLTYTIVADSAQVSVVLTPPGGGGTVAILQPLTKQGRGRHAVAFDGTVDGGVLADGPYDVVLFGIDSGGQGEERRTLPLGIDTVAPRILSLDPIQPDDAVVRNGDLVVLDACVDGDPVAVTASFAALDIDFDPARVTVTPLDEACRRITYAISATNDRTDAAELPVTVTAVDAGGNSARGTVRYCLSNDPPVVVESRLTSEFAFFQNGDRIVTEISFASPALELFVSADFSALDSGFDPSFVAVRNLGAGRYEVSYEITDQNVRPDGEYRLVLSGRDPGCGEAVDSTLTVNLDNAGTVAAVVGGVSLEYPAFSPNGDGIQDEVTIFFTALEDSVVISLIALGLKTPPNDREQDVLILSEGIYLRGDRSFRWDGIFLGSSPDLAAVKDQPIRLLLNARSTDSDRRRNFELQLTLDRKPPALLAFVEPQGGVKNGQRLDFTVTYDQSGLRLAPDFSALDSGFTPQSAVAVSDNRDGTYIVSYAITDQNARTDAPGIAVPIVATDPAGNRGTASLVRVCLNNDPPKLVSAEFVERQPPFTDGAQIILRSVWSGSLAPLSLAADFRALDSNYTLGRETVRDLGDGKSFDVIYRISSTNAVGSGTNLPILLTARNGGCGATTVTAFRVDLDNAPGPRPTITPPPSVVRVPSVTLRGEAPEADSVEVRRGADPVLTLPVTDERFEGTVPLVPGENRFSVISIDGAGNRSPASALVEVFFVDSGFFEIPARFAPGDEFFIGLLDRVEAVAVHIFNLEGVEIRRLDAGSGDLFRIPWDGLDDAGALAASGPYIGVLEIFGGQGRIEVLRKAFVFTRRGSES